MYDDRYYTYTHSNKKFTFVHTHGVQGKNPVAQVIRNCTDRDLSLNYEKYSQDETVITIVIYDDDHPYPVFEWWQYSERTLKQLGYY